jgi:anti-anti-sigma factor
MNGAARKTSGKWSDESIPLLRRLNIPGTDMTFKRTIDGATTVLAPSGRLDHETCAAFEAALTAETRAGGVAILDMSDVPYVSSVGLRAIMMGAKESKAAGGKLAVVGLQPVVKEIFEISRFHFVVPIFASLEDAVATLSR